MQSIAKHHFVLFIISKEHIAYLIANYLPTLNYLFKIISSKIKSEEIAVKI